MAVTLNVTSEAKVLHTRPLDLTTYSGSVSKSYTNSLTSSDVSKVFHDERDVTGSETLDLTTGLTDAFGTALVFTNLKHLFIYNKSATASLSVGGGANPVLANAVTISAGGCLNLTSTFAVSGTTKNLLVTPSAGTVTYQIVLVGN